MPLLCYTMHVPTTLSLLCAFPRTTISAQKIVFKDIIKVMDWTSAAEEDNEYDRRGSRGVGGRP